MNTTSLKLKLSLLFLAAMLACFALRPVTVRALEGEAVSDLALAYSPEDVQALEENGYTVMSRPLTGEIRLAYKKGGQAVTGLTVASSAAQSVTVSGISYQKAGSLGSLGSLYFTRDRAAGDAVLSFLLQSDEGYTDQPLYALKNDGTVPLRRDNGAPCNLGDGGDAYLFILRENVFKPFISHVTAVYGSDLKAAVSAAAYAGCTYYYDPGLKTAEGGQTIVIGFTRTSRAAEAVTCIAAGTEAPAAGSVSFTTAGDVFFAGEEPFKLYETKDVSAGNPIVSLTGSSVPVRSSDVMNKWAEKVFVKFNTSAASVNQVKSEPLYQAFLKDQSALTHVPVRFVTGESFVTPLAYTCKADGLPEDIFASAEEEPSESSEDTEDTETDTESSTENDTENSTENNTETDTASDTDKSAEADTTADPALADGTSADPNVETGSDDSSEDTQESVQNPAEDLTAYLEEDPTAYLYDDPQEIAREPAQENLTASTLGNGGIVGILSVVGMAVLGTAGGLLTYSLKNRKGKAGRKEEDHEDTL